MHKKLTVLLVFSLLTALLFTGGLSHSKMLNADSDISFGLQKISQDNQNDETELEKLKKENVQLTEELNKKNKEITNLQKRISQKDKKIRKLEKELKHKYQLPKKPIKSDFFKQYKPIVDPKAHKFLADGIDYAIQLFGFPRIPLKLVYLRRSLPIDPKSRLRKNFQLCAITDSSKGIFTIYLCHEISAYSFWGQLAHEIGHLLNAQLYDAYVEGLNTYFAELLCKKKGLSWSKWENWFKKGNDAFYGQTYFMMKEIYKVAGDTSMKSFQSFVVFTDKAKSKLHIDIDKWLNKLPVEKQKKIKEIILKYAPAIKKTVYKGCSFILPKK